MSEIFGRGSGRQFDVNDLLPFVAAPGGERPVALEGLEISVVVTGMFAETTQTMTFRNPNRRPLEGTLTFPLPDGAVVCGYAIDLDGAMVDGVVVPKQEARRILEAEIRKGVDPGLVEHVQGNVYRTRIYPLPAGGTRTIRIVYVSELACQGNSAAYHLPLAHAEHIERVSLRVEITKGEVVPVISGGLGNLTLASLRDSFVAEATLPRGTACDDLLVRLPDLPRHLRSVEMHGKDAFFAVSSAIPEGRGSWTPRRVALVWDASGSRAEIERDLAFVAALLELWPRVVVDVQVLRDVIAESRSFDGAAEREQLVGYLRDQPRDGGTHLAALDLDALPHPDDEAWLVLSDGLNTLGRGLPRAGARPVHVISSGAGGDSAYLRQVASRGGGTYVHLLQTPPEAAARLVAGSREALRLAGTSGCEDVHVRQAAGRLWVIGRLTAPVGQVRLAGSAAPADHISIPRELAIEGRLVARAWAGQQAQVLAVLDEEAPRILELARAYGVVTPGASLLVLETLEQHLEYEIEPAPSRKELLGQYRKARERRRGDAAAIRLQHVEQVVTLWRTRVQWWQTEYRPRPAAKTPAVERPSMAVGGAPMRMAEAGEAEMALEMERSVSESRSSPDRSRSLDDGFRMDEARGGSPTPMAPPPPRPAPAPRMAAAAAAPPAARPPAPPAEAVDYAVAEEEPAPEEAEELRSAAAAKPAERSPAASIQIKPWSADTPYLTRIRTAADPYSVYLRERAEYAASPAFFLDCGDLFMSRGERALGLRVLSNLVELGLDDPPLLRMYAWRLQQAGALAAAIEIFERVRRMRGDEPQSHRDLALALAERWEAAGDPADVARAMDLLYDVIEREWSRFPEIELIALMELNRLIARASARGIAAPTRVDRRLIQLLDLDLRISLSWDLDLTDVDLHVFEPTGEHAYYAHNQTSMGGLVSRDFREGYGPEEYVLRKAAPGAYQIKAHYYGSRQQTVAGACTVIAHVFLNYGRADEQKQVMTLRLDRPSDQVIVGEVAFAGSPAAPADWKARFGKLRRGMTIDEVSRAVGQPARIEGADETVLVYEPAPGIIVHVRAAPRVIAVQQLMDGAILDLV